MHPYAGQSAVLTTMHGKLNQIAPALASVGLSVMASPEIDTDRLGTFTGECRRSGDMLETAIAKARLGMAATGQKLGLASEGSFGPHPQIPFIAAGTELIVLVDKTRNLIIHEIAAGLETNFASHCFVDESSLAAFLSQIKFPSHALVVRPDQSDHFQGITKGVTTGVDLADAIARARSVAANGLVRIETDMRAHLNPTRQTQIAIVARKLATRIASLCPVCDTPGFGMTKVNGGLPCSDCGLPTDWVIEEIHSCGFCGYQMKKARPDGLRQIEAMHCLSCNP